MARLEEIAARAGAGMIAATKILSAALAAWKRERGVKIDPRRMRPGEVVQLLNSTPLGAVVTEQRLKKHRMIAGTKIGDGRSRIDLFRYVAWLVEQRHAPPLSANTSNYEKTKQRSWEKQRRESAKGRDIGEIPDVRRPRCRARAANDFKFFCRAYLPKTFWRDWSPDHLNVIEKIELCVRHGGLFSIAMPRKSGKTALCEAACLWALLYGYHAFVAIIGPNQKHALDRIDSIKKELERDDGRLLQDFPEVCYPIVRLERINQRTLLYRGKPIDMEFNSDEIVLPYIPGSPAAGARITTAGIASSGIRGLNKKRPDGTPLRPTFILLDDPQDEESAASPAQCQKRESIIQGAILGMAGDGAPLAALMPCTIVADNDLAVRYLNQERHREWQGSIKKLVYNWGERPDLWDKYREILSDFDPDIPGDILRARDVATKFVSDEFVEMHKGSAVGWPARFDPGEVSALQHAVNLQIRVGKERFSFEYQNEVPDMASDEERLCPDDVANKLNGLKRFTLPAECEHLTAFIDVQEKALYYVVCGWSPKFDGWVCDYGTFPEQSRRYFTLRDIRATLATTFKGQSLEARTYSGLDALINRLVDRSWKRADGAEIRVSKFLIDAGWGELTATVDRVCQQSAHAGILLPSHGHSIRADDRPMREWSAKNGAIPGHYWRRSGKERGRSVLYVTFDTNFWKSFVHSRLSVPMGGAGCLSLWGGDPDDHRLFSEHVAHAEFSIKTEGRGRTVYVWKPRVERFDNHWFDGIVGCAVGASMLNCSLMGEGTIEAKKKLRLSEIWKEKNHSG